MSSLRACDICGALAPAEDIEVGRGVLHVVKRMPDPDPFAAMFRGQRDDGVQRFDFCQACTTHLIAMMHSRTELC